MTNTTTDTIRALLDLDPSVPDQAARLRRGIATILDPNINVQMVDSDSLGRPLYQLRTGTNGMYTNTAYRSIDDAWDCIPPYEASLDAAVTLPMHDAAIFTIVFGDHLTVQELALMLCRAWLRYELARRGTIGSEAE